MYEDHKFFNYCDEHGIMVWQDFSMACHIYPETEEFLAQLGHEVEWVVRELRNHPSIVLWAGDNELDVMLTEAFVNPATNKINREFIPAIIDKNDIGRPYLASSPFFSEEVFKGENKAIAPSEGHIWGPRDYFKSDFYKNDRSHFISEIGYHGCPSLESIKKFITPDKVWPYQDNSEWILHSSDQQGNDYRVMLMEKQIRQLFGSVPEDPQEFIIASQISQAEAKKYFIERMRAKRPLKTGIIWWNLLDGWPQMSDAIVDYYFEKKLSYGYIKRSQAPFTILFDEIENWKMKLFAGNDTLTEMNGHYAVLDALTDEILLEDDFSAKENASTCIGKLPINYSEHRFLIIKWTANGQDGFNHYMCGYPPISLEKYKEFMKKIDIL